MHTSEKILDVHGYKEGEEVAAGEGVFDYTDIQGEWGEIKDKKERLERERTVSFLDKGDGFHRRKRVIFF